MCGSVQLIIHTLFRQSPVFGNHTIFKACEELISYVYSMRQLSPGMRNEQLPVCMVFENRSWE